MIKWPITYTDFDGNERTEEFRFALSKTELMEMNLSETGGMANVLQRVVDSQDAKRMMEFLKIFILKSYGELSTDGKLFVKRKDGHLLADDFEQSAAYDEMFMQLASDEKAAEKFITGVIPASLAKEIEARESVKALPNG